MSPFTKMAYIQVESFDIEGKTNEEHIHMTLEAVKCISFKANSWLWSSLQEAALTKRLSIPEERLLVDWVKLMD